MRYGLSESAAPDPSQVAKALEEGLGWLTRAQPDIAKVPAFELVLGRLVTNALRFTKQGSVIAARNAPNAVRRYKTGTCPVSALIRTWDHGTAFFKIKWMSQFEKLQIRLRSRFCRTRR
jgi:hypothetical protein